MKTSIENICHVGRIVAIIGFVFSPGPEARASECPPPPPGVSPGCKIITINPAEELSLIGPSNILDSALWARRMELDTVTRYWREKLQNAPKGDSPVPPAADKPPAKE